MLLKAVAANHDVAAKLIATSDDLDKIALDDHADVSALHGWRRDLFGEHALAIKAGRLAIAIDNGKVVTLPVDASARADDTAIGENAPSSASTGLADEDPTNPVRSGRARMTAPRKVRRNGARRICQSLGQICCMVDFGSYRLALTPFIVIDKNKSARGSGVSRGHDRWASIFCASVTPARLC